MLHLPTQRIHVAMERTHRAIRVLSSDFCADCDLGLQPLFHRIHERHQLLFRECSLTNVLEPHQEFFAETFIRQQRTGKKSGWPLPPAPTAETHLSVVRAERQRHGVPIVLR